MAKKFTDEEYLALKAMLNKEDEERNNDYKALYNDLKTKYDEQTKINEELIKEKETKNIKPVDTEKAKELAKGI